MIGKLNTEKRGELGEVKDLTFRDAYEGFHAVVRKEIYQKIMGWTEWSKYTFYAKKNGMHPLKPLEAKIIELVFEDYGVDAWTGKEIMVEEVESN